MRMLLYFAHSVVMVPGEMPTSGMAATVDPRMQYLAAIERQGASRGTGGAPLARAQANEAARVAPLENIAAPGRETFNPTLVVLSPPTHRVSVVA